LVTDVVGARGTVVVVVVVVLGSVVVVRMFDDDVVVVVVPPPLVVVVVDAEQTVTVTVWGNGGLNTVPAEGLWLCTMPGLPPVCEQSTVVTAEVRPGVAAIAARAPPDESLTTLGTVAEHGPLEMPRLIGVPVGTSVPVAGDWEATSLAGVDCEQADVWVPTVRFWL
jgi:hypothetical protein